MGPSELTLLDLRTRIMSYPGTTSTRAEQTALHFMLPHLHRFGINLDDGDARELACSS